MPSKTLKKPPTGITPAKKGLANGLRLHVLQKLNLLKGQPFSSVTRYNEVRTAVFDIFPYMAHYVVDEMQKLIIITAVLHTSRNPGLWKKDRNDADSAD